MSKKPRLNLCSNPAKPGNVAQRDATLRDVLARQITYPWDLTRDLDRRGRRDHPERPGLQPQPTGLRSTQSVGRGPGPEAHPPAPSGPHPARPDAPRRGRDPGLREDTHRRPEP